MQNLLSETVSQLYNSKFRKKEYQYEKGQI